MRALENEREKLKKDKEKLFTSAKAESRRIINERTADAEEILHEIEEIFARENISQADLIKARTLKNKLADKAFESEHEDDFTPQYAPVKANELQIGARVFVKTLTQEGIVQNIS